MADTKISALPAVAVPAVGDEFACNQAGVTKKETKAQITAATDANLTAHAAVTAAGVHGSATATGANTLVHRDAAGDADATAFNAAAGAAGTPSHTFTADPNTGLYRYAADELGIATGGAHRAHWNTTGAVILNNAAASTFMTGPGVTIQQGALDDEAVAIKSTDVTHGMTTLADTDTYATIHKSEPVSGGAAFLGYKDADGFAGGAAALVGYLGEDADTTKTTAGRAIVEAVGYIRDAGTPTDVGNTNADGNVFGVRTYRGGAHVTLLLVDEDGDLHALNDIVVAGVVDTIDVANHTHTGAAGLGAVLANNIVTNAIIRDSAAWSVIGRAAAAGGDPADIVAGADNQVLARTGGTLAFQAVVPAMVTDRTRKFFVPAFGSWNMTTGLPIGLASLGGNFFGYPLLDAIICVAAGRFTVPEDFASGMTATAVHAGANGAVFVENRARYGQCAEDWDTHEDIDAYGQEGNVLDKLNCMKQLTLANEAKGDIVSLLFYRDGANVLDTIGTTTICLGWIVSYTADS